MTRSLKSQWATSNAVRNFSDLLQKLKPRNEGKERKLDKSWKVFVTLTHAVQPLQKHSEELQALKLMYWDSDSTVTLPLRLHRDCQGESFHTPTPNPALCWGPVPGQSYLRQLTNKSHCKQLLANATIIDCLGDEMADEMLCWQMRISTHWKNIPDFTYTMISCNLAIRTQKQELGVMCNCEKNITWVLSGD